MSRVGQIATIVGIIVLDVPVTFVLTIMLFPVWSAIERRWGIESVGHSGPAEWCFWAVFGCVVAISLGAYFIGASRPGVERRDGESTP